MPTVNRREPEYYEVICPETGDHIVMRKAYYMTLDSMEPIWRKDDDKEIWRLTKADIKRFAAQERLARLRAYKRSKFPQGYILDLLVLLVIMLLLMKG